MSRESSQINKFEVFGFFSHPSLYNGNGFCNMFRLIDFVGRKAEDISIENVLSNDVLSNDILSNDVLFNDVSWTDFLAGEVGVFCVVKAFL